MEAYEKLANHLDSIKNHEEQEIITHAINELDIKTLKDISEITIEYEGVRASSGNEYKSYDEAVANDEDEDDFTDLYSLKFGSNKYEYHDSYEADTMREIKEKAQEAIKENPDIGKIDITNFDTEKVEQVANQVRNIKKITLYKEIKEKLKPKSEEKPTQSLKI